MAIDVRRKANTEAKLTKACSCAPTESTPEWCVPRYWIFQTTSVPAKVPDENCELLDGRCGGGAWWRCLAPYSWMGQCYGTARHFALALDTHCVNIQEPRAEGWAGLWLQDAWRIRCRCYGTRRVDAMSVLSWRLPVGAPEDALSFGAPGTSAANPFSDAVEYLPRRLWRSRLSSYDRCRVPDRHHYYLGESGMRKGRYPSVTLRQS